MNEHPRAVVAFSFLQKKLKLVLFHKRKKRRQNNSQCVDGGGGVTPGKGQLQENLTGLSQIQLPLAKVRYANVSLSPLVTLLI